MWRVSALVRKHRYVNQVCGLPVRSNYLLDHLSNSSSWATEFGRMPCSQGSKGRNHNPFAFTTFFAGGGFKGGASYGASDEWSY